MTNDKTTPKAEIVSLDDLYREAERLDVTPRAGCRATGQFSGKSRELILCQAMELRAS